MAPTGTPMLLFTIISISSHLIKTPARIPTRFHSSFVIRRHPFVRSGSTSTRTGLVFIVQHATKAFPRCVHDQYSRYAVISRLAIVQFRVSATIYELSSGSSVLPILDPTAERDSRFETVSILVSISSSSNVKTGHACSCLAESPLTSERVLICNGGGAHQGQLFRKLGSTCTTSSNKSVSSRRSVLGLYARS